MRQEYEKVLKSSGDMIAVVDREYRWLQPNRALLEGRGLGREGVVGHALPRVLGEQLLERVANKSINDLVNLLPKEKWMNGTLV